MSTKSVTTSSIADTLKLMISVALLVGGIVGYNYFAEQYIEVVRVVGLILVTVVAMLIALQTEKGRLFKAFVGGVNIELRKVVWPTRAETIQTTLVVILIVLLVGVFLWLVDMFFGWAVRQVIASGG